MGIPCIHESYSKYILKRKAVTSQTLVLTFDDGPGNRATPAILDLLEENNAKGTFFLLGRNIESQKELVRDICQRGHQICSHGFEHLNYLRISPWRAIKDIERGFKTIDAALGIDEGVYFFRPPYGKLNFICLLYLFIKNIPIAYWTDDSGDTWKSKPDCSRISNLVKSTGGSVCLFHDFDRTEEKNESWVRNSVQLVLDAAKEKCMKVVTISELIDNKAVKPFDQD